MGKSVDKFKEFVKKYPKLKYEVREGKQTWQSIYEEWALLGDDDDNWSDYKGEITPKKVEKAIEAETSSEEGQEFLKNILNYVKKVNPDDITKTIGSVQKVLGLVQMFNGGNNNNNNAKQQNNYSPRRNVDPLFRRYDDYDD